MIKRTLKKRKITCFLSTIFYTLLPWFRRRFRSGRCIWLFTTWMNMDSLGSKNSAHHHRQQQQQQQQHPASITYMFDGCNELLWIERWNVIIEWWCVLDGETNGARNRQNGGMDGTEEWSDGWRERWYEWWIKNR